ncbi:MAG: hypothetical protein K0Q87_4853, partial [Neobacillus sp.]|nr:hypothetical protein [Neobacillus sp.]
NVLADKKFGVAILKKANRSTKTMIVRPFNKAKTSEFFVFIVISIPFVMHKIQNKYKRSLQKIKIKEHPYQLHENRFDSFKSAPLLFTIRL